MKPMLTGTIFLTLLLCASAAPATRGQEASRAPQEEEAAAAVVGFSCPGREPNRPRPEVKFRLGDITRKALERPRPRRPARAPWARGEVRAEVVVDILSGRVVWARLLSGHPLLQSAVAEVVCRVRFAHTNDVNARASGTLTYRFGRRR